MKKFNPDLELSKMQNQKNVNYNSSKVNNVFVPLLVVGCSCLAMIGVTFSSKLANDEKESYTVNIGIINGEEDSYIVNVPEGPFSTILKGNGEFGSLTCSKGELNYDSKTNIVSSLYVNSNIDCVLAFRDNIDSDIDLEKLNQVNDNFGISYYYKSDATNNFVKIKNDLYRIVRVNGNGTIRLMAENDVLIALYGDYNNYMDSGVKTVVEEWFKQKFNNEDYLTNGDFDITNYNDYDFNYKNLVEPDGYTVLDVGVLSVKEAALISDGVTDSYLNTLEGIYLANPNGAYETYMFKDGKVMSTQANTTLNVKPVINIKNVKFSGDGTKNNPYVIEEE